MERPLSSADRTRIPSGWFAIARAADLARGQQLTLTRFGRELVLFRTEAGQLSLVGAYCPHMGAHLGHGGTVKGETLQCPFHGFRFATDGGCTHAGPGARVPRGAELQTWPLTERDGFVFAWHGTSEPTYDLPAMPAGPSMGVRRVQVDASPLDTTENSVDLAHFVHVHGYDAVDVVTPLERDGEVLRIAYRAVRPTGPFGTPLSFTYRVEAHGLGLSRVRVEIGSFAVSELLVLASPVDEARSEVFLGARMQVAPGWSLPGLRRWMDGIASEFMAQVLRNDVLQDAEIWSHKRSMWRPRLSSADGPIGPYRAWAKQFFAAVAPLREVACR